ncbi:beta-lactamase family protein [Kineosporia rhizophila]|uniref:serine hydrolase domain-containing protein n=1 Tax=Kineosporia rhizophila TaxID=84633 RepID=UPI000A8529A2|nr:serine hydrolase domain-containing protein [Kineosporia rhizophila]MCE0539577.1 beta-lactamase family protein [Kineosporia rhizophila]
MESTWSDSIAPWSGTLLVAGPGGIVHEESSGFADGPDSSPCGPHLRFQASSVSKQVLSVVALALQQRGRLQLGRPIRAWLPELPPAFDQVTLHHLLTHTSGTGHWADLRAPYAEGRRPESPPAAETLQALIAETGLLTPPGRSWRYSGPGFFLAARVLEAVTGHAYRDLVADLVFGPAGMTSSTSGHGVPADAAVGHRAGLRIDVDPGWTQIPGTGDLWTTAADLLNYSRALRGGRLLAADAQALLWKPQVALSEQNGAAAYGYGTFVGQVRGHAAWFVPGDNPGYQSLLAHLPDSRLDLVVLCNDEQPGVDAVLERPPVLE